MILKPRPLALAILAAFSAPAVADYNVTVVPGASSNGAWSGGNPDVWAPSASGASVSASEINSRLAAGTPVSITTAGGGAETGDLLITRQINWSGNTTLTLTAAHNIEFAAALTATGNGAGLVLTPGGDYVLSGGRITLSGSAPSLTIAGNAYTVINSVGVEGDTSANTLQGMNSPANFAGRYALGSNIDATVTSGWSDGFHPIGCVVGNCLGFSGTLAGLGHYISNLTISHRPSYQSTGLIGLGSGNLRDIGLAGGSVTDSDSYVGGLFGQLAGGTVERCYSTATVDVTGAASWIGGLVGTSSTSSVLTNNYVGGSVTGDAYVGGLAGKMDGSASQAYARGSVTANSNGGGLVAYSTGTVTGSYWDTQTSNQATSAGGTGKTTAEMKQKATYTGWDFDKVWRINEGNGYPFLRWESQPPLLASVGVSGTTASGTTLAATSDLYGDGYWIVVARDATAPSAAQVKAGADYGAVTKIASGNAAMTANVAKNFSVTGLTAGTDYDLYFAAEDGSGNLSAAATKVQFSTAAADTTPDAFGFTDQTGIALSTLTESAAITVAGIDSAAAISVSGGEYQVNGGAWVSGAGTVSNADTVKVRHTSSGSYSTATNTVLTIGGVSDTFSTTTLAAPAPEPAPPPPAPTAVTIGGPGQSVAAVAGLPIRIAAGANVEGTTISFPENAAIAVELGGASFTVAAMAAPTRLGLKSVVVDGVSTQALYIVEGSARVAASGVGETMLVLADGATRILSGAAGAEVGVTLNGSDATLFVRLGYVVLPGAGQTRGGTEHSRAASAELRVYAGERALLDAAGRVTTHVLGNETGDGAGNALSLELPANLSIAASVPRLDATAARLGTTLQQAIAAAAGGRVDVGQTNGVLRLDLDGQRLYVLPLGEASIDADAADGVSLAADGTAIVTAQGVSVTLAPSVANLGKLAEDIAATLPGATVVVRENGLIVATAGDATYVVRPDWVTQFKVDAPAGFSSDAAGQLGYAQGVRVTALHPAFADFARLEAAVLLAVPGATATTNPDGTVTVAAGENRWTLTPVHALETAPAGQPAWWVDDAGRSWLRNGDGTMQEFRIE